MIELLDPRKIAPVHPELWANAGWSYALDYSWIIRQAETHGAKLIIDAGCGVAPYSPLGGTLANLLKAKCIGVDRIIDEVDFYDFHPTEAPDIIFWASSLEHNKPEKMSLLYLLSMEMLAPGGLFLATITIAEKSFWFEPSANSCLSPWDAVELFNEDEFDCDYGDVWQAYRSDQAMMARYQKRYGHFNESDPIFLIAGVTQVKQ